MSSQHHRHHRHRRHDVYDDTHHSRDYFDPEHAITVHHHDEERPPRRSHRRDAPESGALMPGYQDMDSAMRAVDREMERAFGGFGGGLFGSMRGMMTSFDRMFDEAAANAGPGSGGTYYYESRTTTVGPDGRVREETVRTTPDAQGNPETRRTVREGDHVEEFGPHHGGLLEGPAARRYNDDVIVEEIDDDEDAHEHARNRRHSRDRDHGSRHDRRQQSGGWLKDKYREWRNRA